MVKNIIKLLKTLQFNGQFSSSLSQYGLKAQAEAGPSSWQQWIESGNMWNNDIW